MSEHTQQDSRIVETTQTFSDRDVNSHLGDVWENVSQELKITMGHSVWVSWFSGLYPLHIKNRCLVMVAKTSFMCQWITSHYHHILLDLWDKEMKIHCGEASTTILDVQLITYDPEVSGSDKKNILNNETKSRSMLLCAPRNTRYQKPLYTFENFVVGEGNQIAHSALQRLVKEGRTGDPLHNPLCVVADVGFGKTHLLRATEHALLRGGHEDIIYKTADDFMISFLKALRTGQMLQFKLQFQSCNVLLIDDLHLAVGKKSTQEEFSYIINYLLDSGRQLIISSVRPITSLRLNRRLTSRIMGGLAVSISSKPDRILYMQILQQKNRVYGSKNNYVSAEILEFLAQNITSSVRELEGALKRLLTYNTLSDKEINIPQARKILNDLLNTNPHGIKIDTIQKHVAKHYGITYNDMLSKRRLREITIPRQMAMYLSKTLTTRSLPDIGRKFGRDHTTVIHAVRRIKAIKEKDSTVKEDILILKEILGNL